MESILCGVIAWDVIPRGNISREGKHFIDLVFGKKICEIYVCEFD